MTDRTAAALPRPASGDARVGHETHWRQQALAGIGGDNGTLVYERGVLRTRGALLRLLAGDPPRSLDELPLEPQTLVDGRTPAVTSWRTLDGVRYEYLAFETLLPAGGRALALRLSALNEGEQLARARWSVETHPAGPDVTAPWLVRGGQRTHGQSPWALLSSDQEAARDLGWCFESPYQLRMARVGVGGAPIRYAFRVRPGHRYAVAVTFCETTWDPPKQPAMDVEVDGLAIACGVMPEMRGNGTGRAVVVGDVPAAPEDGILRVTLRASADSEHPDPAVSAIWLFEDVDAAALDEAELAAGAPSVEPYAFVDCGQELYRALTHDVWVLERELAPGESFEGEYLRPYPGASTEGLGEAWSTHELLDVTRDAWAAWWNEGTTLRLPDREVEDLWYASLAVIRMLREQIGEHFLVTPGPDDYYQFWFRDACYITHAFEVAGHLREAREALRIFWQSPLPPEVNARASMSDTIEQRADGQWATPTDQLDGQGQATWGLVAHYRLTRDREWLAQAYPALRLGATWTRDQRATTKVLGEDGARPVHYGLFPKGYGETITNLHGEEFWGKTHVLYHNFWGVLALELTAEAAEALGHHEDARWMREEAADFRACVTEACARLFVEHEDGGYWKVADDCDQGPPRHDQQPGVGFWQAAALYPCDVLPAHDPQLDRIFDLFQATKLEGVWPNWPYVTTEWAQGHLLRDEPDLAEEIFWAFVRKAAPSRSWAEEFEVGTRVGIGDQPHGWAAADYVLLLREMLVAERDGELWLCQATPREWLADGEQIEIGGAPTAFGEIDLSIRSELARGRVELAIARLGDDTEPCQVRLWLRLPDGHVAAAATVDGAEAPIEDGAVVLTLREDGVRIVVTTQTHGGGEQ